MRVELQQWGQDSIKADIAQAPGGGATDVKYVLDQIAKQHGSKDLTGLSVLVNGTLATPETTVPDNAVISLVMKVEGGQY